LDLTAQLAPLAGNGLTAVAAVLLVLPLLAFGVLFFFGRRLPRQGDWLGLGATLISFGLSAWLFAQVWGQETQHFRVNWFSLAGSGPEPGGVFTAGIFLDNLAVLMLVVVTLISALVQLFSVSYMRADPNYNRYFAFLGLFTFSMLGIVLADNLLLIFIFWELVGFSSYLLVGFWFERPSAAFAANKAFLVNRIGDAGLLLGLCALYLIFGTFDLEALRGLLSEGSLGPEGLLLTVEAGVLPVSPLLLTLAGLGLFCGCIAKSAQFPLLVWLPDAMEGPTPVSSLIHAATMVAAGVFLLSRCYIFFTPDALLVMAIIGALTAIMGAMAACSQYDIKRVLAFSTISQLGYMVMGMGTGNHDAALFHLSTHAFFKAALFLNAGIVIHALHHAMDHHGPASGAFRPDPQDIRQMGGLRRVLPLTFATYILAAASLVGLPFFSGFLSKDAILSGSWVWALAMAEQGNWWYYLIPLTGFLTVLLTGYYIGRHLWLIFFGSFRLPFDVRDLRISKDKEAPWVMLVPVGVLAILSLGFFFSLNPLDFNASWLLAGIRLRVLHPLEQFLSSPVIDAFAKADRAYTYVHWLTAAGSALLAVAGLALAWFRHRQPGRLSVEEVDSVPRGFLRFLYHNFYLDRLYQAIVTTPALKVAEAASRTDRKFIDYTLDSTGKITVVFGKIIGWFDNVVVDGLVGVLVGLAGGIGRMGRLLQSGNTQSYYIWSVLGFMLLILYVLVQEL
jgi:NADH-quinone oxidoreductase subunit L